MRGCFIIISLFVWVAGCRAVGLSLTSRFEQISATLPPSPAGYVGYNLYRRIATGPEPTTIAIDGLFDDWASVEELTQHPQAPEDQAYLQKAWITHNNTHFFIRIRSAESYWDSQVQFLLDVDANNRTGY